MPADQLWIAETQESASIYPELDDPEFMSLFDLEFSYRQTADIWHPYLDTSHSETLTRPLKRRRRQLCSAFVSSKFNKSNRQQYMAELSRYLPIASYGRFQRNRRLLFDRGEKTKLRVLRNYTYTLAFENSLAEDYVTEKFFQPLMTGAIPIYLGAPNVEDFAPGDNCYIDAARFPDPRDLAAYIRDADVMSFHAWRNKPLRSAFVEKLGRIRVPPYERLVEAMRRRLSA